MVGAIHFRLRPFGRKPKTRNRFTSSNIPENCLNIQTPSIRIRICLGDRVLFTMEWQGSTCRIGGTGGKLGSLTLELSSLVGEIVLLNAT